MLGDGRGDVNGVEASCRIGWMGHGLGIRIRIAFGRADCAWRPGIEPYLGLDR